MKKDHSFNYTLNLKLRSTYDFFGPGVVELLQRIQRTESLNTASKEMGMSYNKAWRIMKRAEESLGYPLIIKTVGGNKGGGSTITEQGQQPLEKYLLFQKKTYEIADTCFRDIFGDMERDGA